MRSRKEKGENWRLIKRDDETARPGSEDVVIRDNTTSVVSSRDLPEIAAGTATTKKRRARLKAPKAPPAPRKVDPAKLAGVRPAPLAKLMKPQLATLVEEAPESDGWLSEIKFDGYRMLARKTPPAKHKAAPKAETRPKARKSA